VNLGGYEVWELGYEHTDPSLNNLMVDGGRRGILNDWAFAVFNNLSVRETVTRKGHEQSPSWR
jgi:hypothetical protein